MHSFKIHIFLSLILSIAWTASVYAEGCIVESVVAGAPGEKAGLKAGDVIVAANGHTIGNHEDLTRAINGAGSDLRMFVRRGEKTEDITATLGPLANKGPRLGVQCNYEGGASAGVAEDSGSIPRGAKIYLGPMFSRMAVNGDFEGNQVLVNSVTGEIAAVPEFDSGFGYGGVVGLRNTIPRSTVDLGVEVSYQEASMNAMLVNGVDFDSKVHELGFLFRTFFRSDKPLQPTLAAGFGVPWITVEDGVELSNNRFKDAEFAGFTWQFGGGLAVMLSEHFSADLLVMYKHRNFNEINGTDVDDDLLSGSFEPAISLRYHFFIGKPKQSAPAAAQPAAIAPAPKAAGDEMM